MPTTRQRSAVLCAAVLATALLGLTGCGDEDAETTTTTSSTSTTTSSTSTSTEAPTTADASPTAPPSAPGPLPGDPVDGFAADGDVLAVVGVAHDDVLNVRAGPGVDSAVVAEAGPTDDVVATGRARRLTRSIWYEVVADGVTGWVNSSFVAFVAGTDDATAATIDRLGSRPTAADMAGLGRVVASGWGSTEPASRIEVSVAPTEGDLGEVTLDVVGIGDDAVSGYRLHVLGAPRGDGFALRTVERTVLCSRGTSGELCV